MIPAADLRSVAAELRSYLADTLLRFWTERAPDPVGGGFLTHFDRDGRATGATEKTFLMQVRMVYALSRAHRAGYGGGCGDLASAGAAFLRRHYWDPVHRGWFWSADRFGTPTDRRKIGYGQCFAMYACGEHFLATGDTDSRDAMLETYDAVQTHMADPVHGGYFEILSEDWQPGPPGRGGGDRKSFDVHMHMMEALTTVYRITGDPEHRDRLVETIDILIDRMRDPVHGTGIQQFALDFTALPAIRFDVVWGRDEDPVEGSIPIDITSYGHNVEFAWLLLVAADTLGRPPEDYRPVVTGALSHCLEFGIDWEVGGIFLDGPAAAPTTQVDKQFWQQAEGMVGMLAGLELTGDRRYWQAFENIRGFVFAYFVHRPGGGEWFHKVDRYGRPLEDHLGDHYKISYHTVRAMIECVERLDRLATAAG